MVWKDEKRETKQQTLSIFLHTFLKVFFSWVPNRALVFLSVQLSFLSYFIYSILSFFIFVLALTCLVYMSMLLPDLFSTRSLIFILVWYPNLFCTYTMIWSYWDDSQLCMYLKNCLVTVQIHRIRWRFKFFQSAKLSKFYEIHCSSSITSPKYYSIEKINEEKQYFLNLEPYDSGRRVTRSKWSRVSNF